MGILDSLNPINFVKNAAESLVDSVLPNNLKAVGNDLVDAAVDALGGNFGALGKDASSLLHDAEAALGPLAAAAGSLASGTTEPDAPPAQDPSSSSSPKATGAQAGGSTTATTSSAARKATLVASAETDPPAASLAAAEMDTSAAAADQPDATTPTSIPDAKGEAIAGASTPDGSAPGDTLATKAATAPSSSSSKSASSSDSKDITKFFAQSDSELMNAVRDGNLPDAVKDDPAAMQRLQLRINEIAEMNQVVSQMLAAMHDMNKAVIQNIRA